jgi:hypothetical protein
MLRTNGLAAIGQIPSDLARLYGFLFTGRPMERANGPLR